MKGGVRAESLEKVYSSAAPFAGPGAPVGITAAGGGRRKKARVEIRALNGVSLEIEPGEIFGLLGPNGAGKSTTLGILTTRTRPTAGTAWIDGLDVWTDTVAVKRRIGVVPQRPNLDFGLTAREILLFHGAYFEMPAAQRTARANGLLAKFQLEDRADELVRGFSGGMMQRLSLARALMHDPTFLFLDEPSTGLDPQTRRLLWDLVREYNAEGRVVIVATHNMEEADTLCRRLAVIDHGTVIALGTPRELKALLPGAFVIRLQVDRAADGLKDALALLPGVTEVHAPTGPSLEVYADRGGPLIEPIVGVVGRHGASLTDVHIAEPSLEDVFLHLTGRSLRT